jgi:DNA repair ATPase RecN
MTSTPTVSPQSAPTKDPRQLLVDWANKQDSWIRRLVGQVLASQAPLGNDESAELYKQFLSEKGLNGAKPAVEPKLEYAAGSATAAEQLRLERLSDVAGVNALTGGATIEFCSGLTILYGENGTGKTGYARILKRLAAIRHIEDILPNINVSKAASPEAKISYRFGKGAVQELVWKNESGVAPFTKISIFDAPSVNLHVDENLSYLYTPAELSLFSYAAGGIAAVQDAAIAEAKSLKSTGNPFTHFFDRSWPTYSEIETLGPTTDLTELARQAELPAKADEEKKRLENEVASLRANTLRDLLSGHKEAVRALESIEKLASSLKGFDREQYNEAIAALESVREAYRKVREESFAKGELAGPADDHWEEFVRAGGAYRDHLGHSGEDRCPYCRQELTASARKLLAKYAAFLDDALASEVAAGTEAVAAAAASITNLKTDAVAQELARQRERGGDDDSIYATAEKVISIVEATRAAIVGGGRLAPSDLEAKVAQLRKALPSPLKDHRDQAKKLAGDMADRESALQKSENELADLSSRIALSKYLPEIRTYVDKAKRAQKLSQLATSLATTLRGLTEVSKLASEQLINHDFQTLFEYECKALRAPKVQLEFVGREGKAQRRKTLTPKYRLSQILSEGEQKVLALADFLAEAQLGDSTGPIVFDDPVSSLDHLRLDEVASRVARLVDSRQVIVFTHSILLATQLLDKFEKRKDACVYYTVTDDETKAVKGRVDRGSGPRWDSERDIGKRVNELLEAAAKQSGETQIALVERAYGLMRSWCEVFVEQVLFASVTQRYRANVMMGKLTEVKPNRLAAAMTTTTEVFDKACRYMPDHSQPLETLGKRPTLAEARADWKKCEDALKAYRAA